MLKVTGEDKDPLTTMVEEVMTRDPERISVNCTVRDVISLMHSKHVRRVPIVDASDTVLGIITMDDLIGLFGDEMSELGETVARGVRRENPH